MLQHLFNMLARGGDAAQRRPSMDGMLDHFDNHLDNFATLVRPAPESRPRTPFDADNVPAEEVSMLHLKPRQRLQAMRQGVPLFLNMQRGARLYDGTFQPTQNEVSPAFIAELEALARRAGAQDIRYVRVPPQAIFQGRGIPHEYAIVFTVKMEQEPIETAPSFICQHEVMRGYKNLSTIGMKLTRFLRQHGYAAYPGTALGGVTDYPHLAELAGLGAIGYHGLLIAPQDGARLRISTIYTNITNLPLADPGENEHLWVRDFCAMCKKCVRQCPADAIYAQPEPRGDGGMQCIDHDACRDYFTRHFGCGVCLAVCPFSHTGYDKIKARFKGNPDAPQFVIPVEPAGQPAEPVPA